MRRFLSILLAAALISGYSSLTAFAKTTEGQEENILDSGYDSLLNDDQETAGDSDNTQGADETQDTTDDTPDNYTLVATVIGGEGGTIAVDGAAYSGTGSVSVAEDSVVTVTADPDDGYTLEALRANGTDISSGATIAVSEDTTITASFALTEEDEDEASAIADTLYAVAISSVSHADVSVSTSGTVYDDAAGTATSSSKTWGEGTTKYLEDGASISVTISADSGYTIAQIDNTAAGSTLQTYSGRMQNVTKSFTVSSALTLDVTMDTLSSSGSSTGEVAQPAAVQDDDGDPLEDNDGKAFDIDAISSDGILTLDGLAPGQTFYIKLGAVGYDPLTTLDDGTHTAYASQLVDDDLFKLSTDKSGTGKTLISSVTQVSEKNLDGTRGSYLKVVLKDSTTTEELKATAEMTFKAKATLDTSDGDEGTWDSGDTATLKLTMWINNTEISDTDGSADAGDSVYINPTSNDLNTFVWGDDRAALEFYADTDADAFYARLSTKTDVDIYTEYGDPVDAELYFYNFVGSPSVPSTSRASLTLGIPWDDDDDYAPDPEVCYIYQLESDGTITDVTDRFTYSEDSYEIPGWTIQTRVLGSYIVSDTELDLENMDYEVDYDDEDTGITDGSDGTSDDGSTGAGTSGSYDEMKKVIPVTGGGDYYVPVTDPGTHAENTVADETKTTATQTLAIADDSIDFSGVTNSTPTANTEQQSGFPWLALALTVMVVGLGAGGGYYAYRRFYHPDGE